MRILVLICLLLLQKPVFSQKEEPSFYSLKQQMKVSAADTSLVSQMITLIIKERKTQPTDTLIVHCSFLYENCKKENNYDGIGFAATTLGNIYTSNGDYSKALFYLFDAEKAFLKVNKPSKLARVYNIIGNTYLGLEKGAEQKIYFAKCYEIGLKYNLPDQEALGAAGIANYYTSEKKYAESNKWNLIAEKLFKEQKYAIGYAIVQENIADNYCQLNELDKAMEYCLKSEKSLAGTDFNYAYYGCYKGKGNILEKQNKYQEAVEAYKQALEYILKDKANHNIAEIYKLLSDACIKTNQLNESVTYLNLHIQYKDSVFNESSRKQLLDIEKKYETEKKDTEIKLLNQENDLNKSELGKKKILIYSASIVIIFLLAMAFFIFRSNVHKNKANKLLARQKVIIEEKQKEILDSIHYAKRIQDALFEHSDALSTNIKNNFIFFQPKDIVSGDFYWATEKLVPSASGSGEHLFYLAVCDSTGHGVPGAFMSLLNIGFLNEAINEKNIREPNKVFDYVKQRLISSISKEGQRDGFDGLLLCLNKNTNELTYAAANNAPLLITENGITEQKKNKMPVGKGEYKEGFDLFSIDWKPGDMLYLSTDGYADQFGGPDGKKFKYKKLNEFIYSIHNLPLEEQNAQLQQKFHEWKGNLEQIDDVCIIGIRL